MEHINAIHVLFPSFLLNENLSFLRRLSTTLASSASRNNRFLFAHMRFVRSVIHDRLEQKTSEIELLALIASSTSTFRKGNARTVVRSEDWQHALARCDLQVIHALA
jgi:hypothetical protein